MAATVGFISRTKGYDEGTPTIEDTYQVLVETANDTDAAIAAVEARGVPGLGYRTRSIRAAPIKRNPLWFEVTASYKGLTGGATSTDPLDRPSVLSGSYEEWTGPYFEDRSPTPKLVVNSAGDRFEEMPQRKFGSLVLQVTKNVATYNAATYDAIKFTTNGLASTIKGTAYGVDTLLFLPPSVQEVYEQVGTTEYHYFTVTFRLATDADLHRHVVSDRGFKQFFLGDSVWILSGDNQPVESPWPLDGAGVALTAAQVAAGTAPAELTFLPYESKSWGVDFS